MAVLTGALGQRTSSPLCRDLATGIPRAFGLSISSWISAGPAARWPMFVVIDAKGLWTKIEAEYKTEKRGAIYIRQLMEILTRTNSRVFWVNSGHMISDALTKLSTKPDVRIDLLLYVLEHGLIRITYCEHSWRRELAAKGGGRLEPLQILNPDLWNHPGDTDYDTPTGRPDS